MDPIIGIDLGTTFSAAAILRPDGPELIPNALGNALTPSVVGIDERGQLVVGGTARELRVTQPEKCASLFKRQMGTDWTIKLGQRSFTPEELSSRVLAAIKADADAHLNTTVRRAVITVPAYFNDRQRKATMAAGRIAGFEVERIINEPTAAALAYGLHETHENKVLLIFDLGGGTFDVSIVDLFDGTIEVRSSAGESFLGGEDFTRTLAARLLDRMGRPYEHAELAAPLQVARLLQLCEVAKCKLSRDEETSIRIPDQKGEIPANTESVTVSRKQFEDWTEHLLARVELPIRRVLGDAKLSADKIDEVILVGGATRMPQVVRRVTQMFGKAPQCRLNPDEVVARGAAVQAGLFANDATVGDLVVTDVAPFTLGISVSKKIGSEHRHGYYLPIIERNTTIPVSRVHRVYTMYANQTVVSVQIYQGENRRVDGNLLLGSFDATGIPAGPVGQEIDIRFTYDLNGVLEVEATVVATQKKMTHVVTQHAHSMSAKQIETAVRAMAKLKTHPRDDDMNRFLLQRAERVYTELPADERDFLSQLLDGFESALESRDPQAIDAHRTALCEFLARHDTDLPNADDDYGDG